jgi:gas vesicle protein
MMKTNFVTFVAGFSVGALMGTAFALLSAPQSGEETRAQIRSGIEEARTRTEAAITEAQNRTLEKMDEVKNLVAEIGNETKKKTEKLLKS